LKINLKIATAIALVATLAGFGALAQAHDSNTLHKWGKAIQYPIRKAGENIDVDVHRSEHKKSVEVDRGRKEKFVIKGNGQKVFKSSYGTGHRKYRHHRQHTTSN